MLTYGHMFRVLSCAMGQNMNQTLSGMDLTFAQGYILGYLDRCARPPCAKDRGEIPAEPSHRIGPLVPDGEKRLHRPGAGPSGPAAKALLSAAQGEAVL